MMTICFTPPSLELGIESQRAFLLKLKKERETARDEDLESYDFAIYATEHDISMLEAEQPKKQLLAA